MMENNRFTICASNYIASLKKEGRYSTAHVYKNAIRSFTQFCGTSSVAFYQINRENLKRYSNYLVARKLKLNTISTYMRMLRCIYNQGVDAGQAPYIYRLFHDVFTGVETRQKKALPERELHTLLYKDPQSESLRRTQAIASLLFQFCGMPFSDLVHLGKTNLKQGILKYNRMKTGTPMCLEILDTATEAITQLRNKHHTHLFDYPEYILCMNMDASLSYHYLEMELHMSGRDVSAAMNGRNLCIYQYVRVISCVMDEIHLVILLKVLQKELKIVLATHSDLVVGIVPHRNNKKFQPEEWNGVMYWDGVKV